MLTGEAIDNTEKNQYSFLFLFCFPMNLLTITGSWTSSSGHSGLVARSPFLPQHPCVHPWHCLALWGGRVVWWCSSIQFSLVRSSGRDPLVIPVFPPQPASPPLTEPLVPSKYSGYVWGNKTNFPPYSSSLHLACTLESPGGTLKKSPVQATPQTDYIRTVRWAPGSLSECSQGIRSTAKTQTHRTRGCGHCSGVFT